MKPHRTPFWFFQTAMVWIVLSATLPLRAAEEVKKVLSTTEINLGERSIIYQRVEPPKETVPVEVGQPTVIPTRTAAEMAAMIAQAQRLVRVTLSLSCTVYETGVTEVRWSHEGAEYRVLSSVDFNQVRSVTDFEADGRRYSAFLGIGNAMSASTLARLQASGAKFPASMLRPAPALPADVLSDIAKNGGSRYVVISAPTKPDAAAYEGIDALHRYFDAHKAELIAAWQQSEAERIAHEQWLKDHPPVPQDTVIQFWPKSGSRYLDAGNLSTAKEAK